MTVSTSSNSATGAAQSSKRVRRAITVGALVMVVIGLVLLYMLMQATNNRELYEVNYARLFTINVAVATMLLGAIVWVAYRLRIRLKQGRFGSRLLVKLATIFALVGLAPGLLIYVVSYQFVSRSIETWFDVKVESALEAGLNLGRVTLDTLTLDLVSKSRHRMPLQVLHWSDCWTNWVLPSSPSGVPLEICSPVLGSHAYN
jgi:nitrogen fixation/metabolism regulation signal transduction histidine kinase